MRIDLHIHSTASDGSLLPAAVVAAARTGRLHVIAIADHDTLAAILPAQAAGAGTVHVVPAVELSTHHDGSELHMLGYYVDPHNAALVDYGARASTAREARMREMIERLGNDGIQVSFDEVLAAAGPKPESIGRPHLARALAQRGYVNSVSEAFDRYIGDHAPAFVPNRLISPAEAIVLIHDAGGVAVWAHPRPDLLEPQLPRFVEWGMDGVECYRPRIAHPDAERIAGIARAHNLFVTGGSDWHGEWQGRLGDFALERDDVADFLERGGI
ncbi:MAG TPA: PHP domain-containing protein [Longimicrobiales bacterium]|nr:PHP domain-containing protein [Longimicrobiales bacterium]